ncbi:MAG: hypothetical protein FWE15_02095 [Actinomycetia bacterium]|nr:hypothetical protein [Actinomycetes bacterium]
MTFPRGRATGPSLEAIAGQSARISALLAGGDAPVPKDYPQGAETGRALADVSADLEAIADYLEANPPGGGGAPAAAWSLAASTGYAGVAINTSTPTGAANPLIEWTAPDDDALHWAVLFLALFPATSISGGQIEWYADYPDTTSPTYSSMFSPSGTMVQMPTTLMRYPIKPGGALLACLNTAVTTGSGTVRASIYHAPG